MIIFKALDKINEINFNEEYMHVPDLELNTFIFGKKKNLIWIVLLGAINIYVTHKHTNRV